MRALSLLQPWASLVAVGAKSIDTRSWGTAYRGPVAIHASKGLGPGGRAALDDLCERHPFRHALLKHHPVALGPRFYVAVDDLPRGAVVAVATLTDVAPTVGAGGHWPPLVFDRFRDAPDEEAFGNYSAGRYAWLLRDVVRLPEPVPCAGALGLWTVPDAIDEAVRAQAGMPCTSPGCPEVLRADGNVLRCPMHGPMLLLEFGL